MRVLHVPYSFPPDPAGGTEIYVQGLAGLQRLSGTDAAIAAPATGPARYEHDGIPVWRFPTSANPALEDLYGRGDAAAAAGFARILDEFAPDIVHLHALTTAVSVRLAVEARDRGIPIVFNYHTPTVSCSRGTLLRWGSEICDGVLDARTCAACSLTAKGMSRSLASLVSSVPPAVSMAMGGVIALTGLTGSAWTAMRMRELMAIRIGAFERMMEMADCVVALCEWTRQLLLRNQVPEEKITLCRQGIVWEAARTSPSPAPPAPPVRLAFLGRLDATKGVDVIVRALRLNPGLAVELDLYGVSQGESGARHAAEVRALIAGDPRIRLLAPVPQPDVVATLRGYHALVVPSQWLETGPLVVLEAFAAGIPVIGSDLGGVAELVTDGVDGMLVRPHASVEAWASAFQRIVSGAGLPESPPESPLGSPLGSLLGSWRAGIRPPRHSRDAAVDFIAIYDNVIRRGSPRRELPVSTPVQTGDISYPGVI